MGDQMTNRGGGEPGPDPGRRFPGAWGGGGPWWAPTATPPPPEFPRSPDSVADAIDLERSPSRRSPSRTPFDASHMAQRPPRPAIPSMVDPPRRPASPRLRSPSSVALGLFVGATRGHRPAAGQ